MSVPRVIVHKAHPTPVAEAMSSHFPNLSPAQNSELTQCLEQFSQHWQRDSIDQIGRDLQAYPSSVRHVFIVELLKVDLELAWKNGIPRKVSAYEAILKSIGLSEGPPASLIFHEFLARYQNGEKPSAKEYKKRFPEQFEEFKELFLNEKARRTLENEPSQKNVSGSIQDSLETKVEASTQQKDTANPPPQFQIKEKLNPGRRSQTYRKKNKSTSVVIGLLLGGLSTIPLGLALLWIIDKQDPLGIFSQFGSESIAKKNEAEVNSDKSKAKQTTSKSKTNREKQPSLKLDIENGEPDKSTADTAVAMKPKVFLESVNRARNALVLKDFDDFFKIIRTTEQSNLSAEQMAKLERLAMVGEYYKDYRDQVIKKCASLKSGEEFTWSNGERISIVDASETKLVYRRGGQRIQENPAEMQDGLALKVLEHNQNSYDTDILLLRGAVFAVRSFTEPEYQARARETWELVDSEPSKALMQHLQDSFGPLLANTATTTEPRRSSTQTQFNSVGFQQKHPIPLPQQLATAKKAIDSAFQKRLEDALKMKDRQDKLQTLNLLAIGIQDAIKDEDDIINTYVIFDKAIEVAKLSCHSETTLNLVDQFSEEFAVDELNLRLNLFDYWESKIPDYFQGPDRYEKFRALAMLALPYAEKSESSFRWQLASDYFELLEKLARACNEKEETQTFRKQASRCQNLARKEAKINQLMIDLESNPTDAAILNTEIGTFFCLEIGDWNTGLPYLAKSDDTTLSKTASMDLNHDAETAGFAGDSWWDAAEDRKYRRWETNLKKRAGELYEEALPNMKGLEKARIRERLDSLNL